MKRRFFALALVFLGLSVLTRPVLAQHGTFEDVPLTDPAYGAIAEMQREGTIVLKPVEMFTGKRVMTRYEWAIGVNAFCPMLLQKDDFSHEVPSKWLLHDQCVAWQPSFRTNLVSLKAFGRLTEEFRPELIVLGQDVSALQTRLVVLEARAAAISFRDVPPNHWAAESVQTLKNAGIVVGYPSQKP